MALLTVKLNFRVSPLFGPPEETVISKDKKDESTNFKQSLKICTWNVRTIAEIDNIDKAIQEMKKMKI